MSLSHIFLCAFVFFSFFPGWETLGDSTTLSMSETEPLEGYTNTDPNTQTHRHTITSPHKGLVSPLGSTHMTRILLRTPQKNRPSLLVV